MQQEIDYYAYLLGFAAGDGSLAKGEGNRQPSLVIYPKEGEELSKVQLCLDRVYTPYRIRDRLRPCSDGSVIREVYMGGETTLVQDLNSGIEKVPVYLWKTSKGFKASWIAGLWDADGYTGTQISFTNMSKHLITQAGLVLASLQIANRVSTYTRIDGKDQHQIYVWKRSVDRFVDLIGSLMNESKIGQLR